MAIAVTHLTKVYGSQKALDDVSFTVRKGEIVGFLGPNGAGKSTAMKILTGFVAPTEGSVSINGYDIGTQRKKVQRSIGYLPEHNPLYPEMYVREFLRFNAGLYRVPKKNVEHVIALTGLMPEAHKKTGQLSKGYRQRVGLAAALLHDPEVLILDEPATGLDPNQLVEIRQLIKRIGREKTILLSTHILQEAEAVCDRVLIMNKGRLAADTALAELRDAAVQVIEVAFDRYVEAASLGRLPDLENAKNTTGFVYELTFSTPNDRRTAVFDFSRDNGLKILQLNRKNTDLEALFAKLTGAQKE